MDWLSFALGLLVGLICAGGSASLSREKRALDWFRDNLRTLIPGESVAVTIVLEKQSDATTMKDEEDADESWKNN